jgi:hypothetical protein
LLPEIVQQRLTHLYALDEQPPVGEFLHYRAGGGRERLLVRHADDDVLEMSLELPREAMAPSGPLHLDTTCQVVEGVSHFVLVADRARRELSTTQLELELQAEIDKFVVLALSRARPLGPHELSRLHGRLFHGVRFVDRADSEDGERYRIANRLGARFTRRLERDYMSRSRFVELREALRRFYRAGPTAKIAMAEAA